MEDKIADDFYPDRRIPLLLLIGTVPKKLVRIKDNFVPFQKKEYRRRPNSRK
jgi:hypothetical protein